MIEIKILKKDEIKKKFDLCLKAYMLAGFTDEEYSKIMIEDAQKIGLAYYNGELAGIGRIIGDRVRVSYIVDLVVLEKHRGKGIGKKLVQELARSAKTTFVALTNDSKNQGLKEFYKKAGFKESIGESVFGWEEQKR